MQKQSFFQFLKTEILSSISDTKYRYAECDVIMLASTLYSKKRIVDNMNSYEAYEIVSRYGQEIYQYMSVKKLKEPDIFDKFFKDSRDVLCRVIQEMIVCMLINKLDMQFGKIYIYTEDVRNEIYNLFLNSKSEDYVFDQRVLKYV